MPSPQSSPRSPHHHKRSSSIRITDSWLDVPLDVKAIAEDRSDTDDEIPFFPLLTGAEDAFAIQKQQAVQHHLTPQQEWSVRSLHFTPEDAAALQWEDVPMGPPDAILGIAQAYRACTDPRKVNVCVGAYRDERGKPWVLPVVKKAEKILWESPDEDKEYLPIEVSFVF